MRVCVQECSIIPWLRKSQINRLLLFQNKPSGLFFDKMFRKMSEAAKMDSSVLENWS